MNDEYEARILGDRWFYRFKLPSGKETEGYGPQQLHDDRLQMMWSGIRRFCGDDVSGLSAIDLACHQGWFSHHLAAGGLNSITGVDARPEHIAKAEIIRDGFDHSNLRFVNHSIYDPAVAQLEPADLVLMYGLLYHIEDPIGALRIAGKLAKRLLLIETQVMQMDLVGDVDWGTHMHQLKVHGSFGVIYEPDEKNLETGISGLALVPSTGVLIWLLKTLGFKTVELIEPPHDGYEQLTRGKRVVVAAAR